MAYVIGRARRGVEPVMIAPGLTVQVRPATSVEMEASRQAVARLLRQMHEGAEIARDYGVSESLLTKVGEDEDLALGLAELMHTAELGLRCIESWNAVDVQGNPAPITRPLLVQVLTDDVALRSLRVAMSKEVWAAQAEGNASRPSLNGGQTGAAPIASRAGKRAPHVPKASGATAVNTAQSTSTRRERRKAKKA